MITNFDDLEISKTIQIEILYKDDDLVVVNKPPQILVHPYGEARDRITLLKVVNEQIGAYLYPIHRLDRQVSGALIFGLKPEPIKLLQEIWHTDLVKKRYTSLVRGPLTEAGEFNFALNDKNKIPKDCLTKYTPIEVFENINASLVEIDIFTGRYHQIRRHFSRRFHQVLGDRKYGKRKYNDYFRDHFELERPFLHSHELTFQHPMTKKMIKIDAPLYDDLQKSLIKIRGRDKNEIVTF